MSMRRRIAVLATVGAVTMLGACQATGVTEIIQLGFIVNGTDTSRVTAPDTVKAGTPFTVSFTTTGGGCVRTIDRTDVILGVDSVIVRPMDKMHIEGTCPTDIIALQHSASVTVPTAGAYGLRILGARRDPNDPNSLNIAYIDRRIIAK